MGWLANFLTRPSAGPVGSAWQRGGTLTATATRLPDFSQGYTSPATDYPQWAYGNINVEPLVQASQFDVHDTFYRWCGQIIDDRTPNSLLRYAKEYDEYMEVYLEMRRLGKRIRQEVGTELLAELRGDLKRADDPRWKQVPSIFDPELPLNWSRAHIMHTICNLNGIDLVRMNEGQKEIAAHYSGTSSWPVYAFMQTYGPLRAPLIAVNVYPLGVDRGPDSGDPLWKDNTNAWTFAAACCLAKYVKDRELYAGMGAQPEIIAPFDLQAHATLIPFFHVFAKALLRFHPRCNSEWPCYCNSLTDMFHLAADTPRQETGTLTRSASATATEPPTPGSYNGFGQAVPHSRGMTPPAGTYLHEYNRRKQTDPNLHNARRETDGRGN